MVRKTIVILLLLGGCDVAEEGAPPPDHSADVARCNQLVSTICVRVAACGPLSVNDCQVSLRREIDCTRAVGVTAGFSQCLREVQTASCQALTDATGELALPVSCVGVVSVR